MRAVIRRDLADASLRGASADRRFATAYNAALQAVKMALHVLAIASSALDTTKILLTCLSSRLENLRIRTAITSTDAGERRNVIDHDDAFVATETEAKEILTKTKDFVGVVEQWIAKNHPLPTA